ncbi:plasmid mobilization relaxosome protein MobC [Sphingobacterium sp. DK4209]|uniref:Plasmid mobilization relaxosome protein MobC n=1 Tax=Sphingobacterium zhuxiongii TaxID=2662364 RepID=A0A5Q0QDC2_9SPHI|nr:MULTISPECIES: plasmid mobilization relaxosome protein MobC [unclassified Sphingobacterium]MVZ67333.1 plasmid mobilization relaxosome protein MobC [Sphingobacterium sp. DK4209]QGA26921.1 plasmid mobilization relaxosome protein MobC [Sphingobacterium sp. dk4302]
MDKEKQNRTRIIGIRVTIEEFQQLENSRKRSTSRKLSEYLRSLLLRKPIVKYYRNQSIDESMTLLIQLRNELNAIGVNLNQAVKKLYLFPQQTDLQAWIRNQQLQNRIIADKIQEIKLVIKKMGEVWLQS